MKFAFAAILVLAASATTSAFAPVGEFSKEPKSVIF